MAAVEKIDLAEFTKYLADALKRWRVRYEREQGRPECPERQHVGGWLRAFLHFVAADRAEMTEQREWDENDPTRKS